MSADHPRVCGEKHIAFHVFDLDKGSPPRMRGKVVSSVTLESSIGITPAYAGKRYEIDGQKANV